MSDVIIQLAIGFILYLASKPLTMMFLASTMVANESYSDFLRSILRMVYASVALVFGLWFVFGDATRYTILFYLCSFLFLCRFEFEDSDEEYQEARKQIIETSNRDL